MKFFLILSLFSVLAHKPTDSLKKEEKSSKVVVNWEKSRNLTWDDFKGTPKSHSRFAAECYWEIQYSYSFNPSKSKIHFDVFCHFNSSKSWVKQSERSPGLLEHEQIHFDIAELCSRRLRKRLTEAKFEKASFKEDINKIFDDILIECDSIQSAYDESTNHGLNKKSQTAWIKNVNKDLKDLEPYENNPLRTFESQMNEENFITKLFRKLNFQ